MNRRKLVVVLAIALVIGSTISAFLLSMRLAEASRRVEHTIGVQVRSTEVLASAIDAETGQRGYLLTKDERYLAPLEQARIDLPRRVAELRQLTGDNSGQQVAVDRIEQLVVAKLTELDGTVELAKAGKDSEALALVKENSGKSLMDSVREHLDDMRLREALLLQERSADARRTGNLLLTALVTAFLSALILALTISAMLRDQILQLETQVASRTSELRVLTQELTHRSNNLLAVIQSIVNQTARSAETIDDMKRGVVSRISGLVRSQEVLLGRETTGGSLHQLVRNQVAPFADSRQISLEGPDVLLAPAEVQALGLALHELATNAAKYGALSLPSGSVAIEARVEAGRLCFIWQEQGGPSVSPPTRRGFGTSVTGQITEAGLGGRVSHEFAADGVRWEVAFPLANHGAVTLHHAQRSLA